MNQPETGDQNRSRRAGVLVLAVTIVALLPAVYSMARPFLTASVLAAILAVALDPLHLRTGRLLRHPSVAALGTTLVVVVPVLAIILLAGMAMNRKIGSGALTNIVRTGQRLTSTASLDSHAIQGALAGLNQIAAGLLTCAFAVVFLFVLLVHGRAWVTQLATLLPLESSVTDRILTTIRDTIVANVDGILAMAVAEAILSCFIFWIARIESPFMWGAFAGLASMIPFVGAAAVWLPLAVTLAVHGAWMKAALVGIACLAAQKAVTLLLVPRIVGTRLRQPPLLIALSVLGATMAFGPLGILLGPVIVSVLAALLQEFRIQVRGTASSSK
jgi:predicted PurR-regulated permease PerM